MRIFIRNAYRGCKVALIPRPIAVAHARFNYDVGCRALGQVGASNVRRNSTISSEHGSQERQTKWINLVSRGYALPDGLTIGQLNPPNAPPYWYLKFITLQTTVVFSGAADDTTITMNGSEYAITKATAMLSKWIENKGWQEPFELPARPARTAELHRIAFFVPGRLARFVVNGRRFDTLRTAYGVHIDSRVKGKDTNFVIRGDAKNVEKARAVLDMYIERAKEFDEVLPQTDRPAKSSSTSEARNYERHDKAGADDPPIANDI